MKKIDKIHLEHPAYGSRNMVCALQDQEIAIGRDRVRRLMQIMDVHAIYPKPRTSQPAKEHKIYPYLLRNLIIDRPNQVWATDITYIPMRKGFLYLVAIMDWASRRVLSWRLSNSMEEDFCVEALEEAIGRYGPPEIFNSDQGAQFTGRAFTGVLKSHGIRISMDGKRSWMDNVFIERLWRSLKWEEVYLYAYDSVLAAETGISTWLKFYNSERHHQGLGKQTPDAVYFGAGSVREVA